MADYPYHRSLGRPRNNLSPLSLHEPVRCKYPLLSSPPSAPTDEGSATLPASSRRTTVWVFILLDIYPAARTAAEVDADNATPAQPQQTTITSWHPPPRERHRTSSIKSCRIRTALMLRAHHMDPCLLSDSSRRLENPRGAHPRLSSWTQPHQVIHTGLLRHFHCRLRVQVGEE